MFSSLAGNPRRIFFCDLEKRRAFYKVISTHPSDDTSNAVELSNQMPEDSYQKILRDVSYFNGNLYWVTRNDSHDSGIGIMTNYDQTNRSYRFQPFEQFKRPRHMLIALIEPWWCILSPLMGNSRVFGQLVSHVTKYLNIVNINWHQCIMLLNNFIVLLSSGMHGLEINSIIT